LDAQAQGNPHETKKMFSLAGGGGRRRGFHQSGGKEGRVIFSAAIWGGGDRWSRRNDPDGKGEGDFFLVGRNVAPEGLLGKGGGRSILYT